MPKETSSTQTPETLAALAETLEEMSSAISLLAETLRSRNVMELEVKNEGQRKRGLVFLNSYLAAIRLAMLEAHEQSGTKTPKKPAKK